MRYIYTQYTCRVLLEKKGSRLKEIRTEQVTNTTLSPYTRSSSLRFLVVTHGRHVFLWTGYVYLCIDFYSSKFEVCDCVGCLWATMLEMLKRENYYNSDAIVAMFNNRFVIYQGLCIKAAGLNAFPPPSFTRWRATRMNKDNG